MNAPTLARNLVLAFVDGVRSVLTTGAEFLLPAIDILIPLRSTEDESG